MSYETIEVRPIAGALGAAVSGADLTALGNQAFSEIHRAFLEHQVLYFDDQPLDDDQLKAFTRQFGPFGETPFVEGMADHPDIIEVRKALYVNLVYTVRLEDMTEEESAPILDYLYAHSTRPEFTCRVRWSKTGLAIWDNCCTQHYAVNDYHGHARIMHRTTCAGDRPF